VSTFTKGGKMRTDNKSETVPIRISYSLRLRLKKAADDRGMKMYSLAELAITKYLDDLEGKDGTAKH